ncbi:Histone-lysine N-methyltransferase PRDM9 [Holothuria leucospilota]|uniref:Histone-lysine N-methyltransferase PRDM9 n=1 Tax=Holothuria leucospilota TaxID=206669 RepID=A0A9Q1H4P7_HOLLE|nr:Histone-lysine N-methyltransferase PRDM9 [Holothuria leucospilota]
MASNPDEYDDLKQYFTVAGWKELSNYEKLRLQNIKRNYEMMIEIGLTVPMPDFMVQKRKKSSRKRTHTGSSDEDDEEWQPYKKSISHPGNTSSKQCQKKQESVVRSASYKSKNKASGDEPKENASENGKDLSYCGRRKPGNEVKKGKKKKKKPKVPERCYPKRKNTHKCYKEETVPDDDHFIYCEDCQEFYETGCLQHPLTIVEDTPVPTRSKNFCKESLPSGLTIKETTIIGAGLGVFAEKNFKKGVRFGPYKGKVVGELDALSSGYAWEVKYS